MPDDYSADRQTAGRVTIGGSVRGEIETAGDRDWFAVTLEAGKTYQFDLKGSGTQDGKFGDPYDPYLYGVHDADGELIAGTADDNGGSDESRNARVRFTPTEDGTYYVAAGGMGVGIGTYTLRARVFGDDFTDGTDTTGRVAVGGSARGELETSGDRDWFAVTLEAGKTYRFDLEGWATREGTVLFPFLHGIYDADGNAIPDTYAWFSGEYSRYPYAYNARLAFTPTEDGVYYVAARAEHPSKNGKFYTPGHEYHKGTYTVSVDEYSPSKRTATLDELAHFLTEGRWFTTGKITVSLSGLSESAKQMARWAMDAWEAVANIEFVEVTGRRGAIYFTDWNSGSWSAGGHLNFPAKITPSFPAVDSKIVDNIVHEIGHALGLGHPGGYVGNTVYDRDNIFANDSYQLTVMSYFSQVKNLAVAASFARPMTPMMADIVAIQNLYGAPGDSSPTAGDTVWGANSSLGGYLGLAGAVLAGAGAGGYGGRDENIALTIYDRDGIDTLDFSTSGANNRIDLRDGRFSDVGERVGRNSGFPDVPPIGNLGIARGTVIEHLISGSGNDDLTGNDADNYIDGGGGNDTLRGGRGNDVLDGGTGDDALYGGEGEDLLRIGRGNDTATGGAGADTFEFYGSVIGANVVTDFEPGVDKLRLDDALWSGALSAAQVVERFASVVDGSVLFDFGGGNTIALTGVTTTAGLADDLEIFTATDDFTAGTDTAGTVAVGGSATGEIEIRTDRDWFAVRLEAGKEYRFDLEGASTGKGTLADPMLVGVYDASGVLVRGSGDRDGGDGLNSRGFFRPAADGTYYVAAGASGGKTGTYTLSVTPPSDDFTAGTDTKGAIDIAGGDVNVTGEVESWGDRDWFAVTLVAGRTYQLDLKGSATRNGEFGTLADPYLYGVHDADGVLVSGTTNDNGGWGANSRMTFMPPASGTWYVAVGGVENGIGTYTLRARDVSPADPPEAPAFGAVGYAFELAENAGGSATPVVLGTVAATDPDDDTVSYSIVGGNDAGLFAIDAATGALSYTGAGEDHESGTTSHELTVRASDGTLRADTTVTVTVTDVAEAPSFASTSYAFALAENADGSTTAVALGTVSATDPEDGDTVAYSIVAGNDANLFAIDADSGALSYIGAGEDYESNVTSHELTVRASDGTLHSDVTVTVNVTNVSDVAPAFGSSAYAFNLAENADGSTTAVALGTVSATDPEDGDTVAYSIVAGNDASLFAIDADSGALSYIGAGEDHESDVTSHALTVRASDGTLHADTTVTVTVTDVAETPVVTDETGDDYTAGTDTTGAIDFASNDVSVTGEVEISGDRDWFAATLEAGKTYQFDLKGSGTQDGKFGDLYDPYLYGVHDAHGKLMAGTADDNGGWGESRNARVQFTPAQDGTYYVAAGGVGVDIGTYTLRARVFGDDFTDGTDTAGAVAVGGSATGDIDFHGDRDWFAMTLEAGKTYLVDLKGGMTGMGTLIDPYLHGIHDADGNLLDATADDNGGTHRNSHMPFTPAKDGTYYVAAGGAGARTGTYTLQVRAFEDDFTDGTDTTGTVAVGGSTTGEIETWADRDWFAVTLEAGKDYRVDLKGGTTAMGTLIDPYLYGIHDADGNLLDGTADDNGGTKRDSRVSFMAAEDGTYYLATGAAGNGLGEYTLSVEEVL